MHLGVKGLQPITHSFGHHLSSSPLREQCFMLYSFQPSFISFERTSLLCLELLHVALDRRGGGILSQGLWGKPHSWFLSTPHTMVSQRYHKQRKVMQPCVMRAGPIFMPRFWISWHSKALWTMGIIHCTSYQMTNPDFLKSTWETNHNDLLKKKKKDPIDVFLTITEHETLPY